MGTREFGEIMDDMRDLVGGGVIFLIAFAVVHIVL